MDPSPTILADRYRLIAPIGGGGPSTTFLGVDQHNGTEVVIKRFAVRDAKAWKQVELAQREAQVLRGLDHALLPRYLDHFELGGALFTVMTRLAGEDLRSARQRGLRLSLPEVFQLLHDASSVFEYLHGQLPPIIHRDIKPSNVLICPDRHFRVVDFGSVAHALRADGTTVVGTFGYMAPEQFQGRAGPGTDIYGLGATILATLTNVEPEAQPHRGLAIDVQQALGASVNPRLCRVLQGMLEPNPDERPTNLRHWLAQSSGVPLALASPPLAPRPQRVASPGEGPTENAVFIYTIVGLGFLMVMILALGWLGPGGAWLPVSFAVLAASVGALRSSRRVSRRRLPSPPP